VITTIFTFPRVSFQRRFSNHHVPYHLHSECEREKEKEE
jgi:hypothetical protein